MAEPVTLQTLLTYLTLISVPVGVFYHIMTLRNTRKNQELTLETRQAQLLMGLINTFNSLEFRKQWVLTQSATWKDHEDYTSKYNAYNDPEMLTATIMMFTFFDSVGHLVNKKLIDIELLNEPLVISIVVLWRRFESIIKGDREYFQSPTMWKDFEYIYIELNKRDQYADTSPPDFDALRGS